jgi:hypothetical protein
MCVGMNCDGSPLPTYVAIRVTNVAASGAVSVDWQPWFNGAHDQPIIFPCVLVPAHVKHACPTCRCT